LGGNGVSIGKIVGVKRIEETERIVSSTRESMLTEMSREVGESSAKTCGSHSLCSQRRWKSEKQRESEEAFHD
jgi:hypothetical protein